MVVCRNQLSYDVAYNCFIFRCYADYHYLSFSFVYFCSMLIFICYANDFMCCCFYFAGLLVAFSFVFFCKLLFISVIVYVLINDLYLFYKITQYFINIVYYRIRNLKRSFRTLLNYYYIFKPNYL